MSHASESGNIYSAGPTIIFVVFAVALSTHLFALAFGLVEHIMLSKYNVVKSLQPYFITISGF